MQSPASLSKYPFLQKHPETHINTQKVKTGRLHDGRQTEPQSFHSEFGFEHLGPPDWAGKKFYKIFGLIFL